MTTRDRALRTCTVLFTFIGCTLASCEPTDDTSGQPGTSESPGTTEDLEGAAAGEKADSTAGESAGFDARLRGYGYPYDVEMFEFEAQRQNLEMAFMDVEPDEPNGRAVLLLHGKNFSGAYWETTIDALTQAGYRVLVPDQIGFGKSSKPTDFQYSFHALATHTRQLADSRGIESLTVVGHSMGGMLASRFALMFPELTEKLALVNPIGLEDWKAKGVPYRTVGDWYRRELEKTGEKVQSYMTENYFDGEWTSDYDPLVEIQAGWTEGPDWEKLAWVSALTYDMIFTQPVVHEFSEIEQPTLLIIGTRDRTALGKGAVDHEVRETLGQYQKLGATAADAIPDAELVEYDDIGHIPQYETFDRYIADLKAFLP